MTADNSGKTARIERLKPHQFKPGVSGNPGGRPKNTLKEFQGEEFRNMTPEQKREFLRTIAKIDRWKMAEGNPPQQTDVTTGGDKIQSIFVTKEILDDLSSNNSDSETSQTLKED
jgi:hypothetical protein